ncbi:MAG: hypothetical protein FWG73_01700 [Planctomycetaceae bacterium]|nr:hypothetical protein [Planctomycetaceae bacterium]
MQRNTGSFRDPSGTVYHQDDRIFRTVNASYKEHFEAFIKTGLYDRLVKAECILPFKETDMPCEEAWKVLEIEKLPIITYPYEWSFQQLKDAALLTLRIQKAALEHGMILKDASAYNIQFYKGKPVFIDLLSFEKYKEGTPWIAYRQYISHFYAPLLLMAKVDLCSGSLLRNFLDGFPLDFVSKSLPLRTRLSPMIQLHIHMHAKMIKKYENTKGRAEKVEIRSKRFSAASHQTMAEGLFDATASIKRPGQTTEWGDYYNDLNYDDSGFQEKKRIVEEICIRVAPQVACDFGANLGEFSRVLAKHAKTVLAPDIDPVAVERNYLLTKKNKEENIYPIVQDLCNPSPGIGWRNQERDSFFDRAKCDLAMGLALIHHLCIGNNLPLDFVADLFASVSGNVILEFVPKEDSQVQRLLSAREDIFPDYDLAHCIEAFSRHFQSCEQFPISGSTRTILFFCRR